ncbi:MAG TPA: LLM class flavin-dependent oxidoreductase [Methylomirabilota bacterium]|jgi:probable F420-dependent oxidoreductase|nr:LLM class flavin-dependent oxidoreductase [Methylomirabilota bacterium]
MTTPGRVKFAIAVPQLFREPRVDLTALREFLQRAETLGCHSVWVQEQILGEAGSLEPVALLAHAAALTERLRLGVAVLLTPLRSPVQLAKALTTVDQLSAGRLIVGVGLGGRTTIYPAFGLSPERRVRRFTEGLEVMKRLWTQDRVTFDGDFVKLEDAAMAPKPVQRPHPPIWFGAHHIDAVRRAVRLGDGFIGAGASSTAEFKDQVAQVRRFVAESGRDPSTFALAKRVYIHVDSDRARGVARLREWFGWYYGNAELAERVAVAGSVEACVNELREIRAAGAELLLLNPVFEEQRHLELFAREVMAAVR